MSSYVGSNQDIQAGSGSERSKIILCTYDMVQLLQ